jgi:hypothetical protein
MVRLRTHRKRTRFAAAGTAVAAFLATLAGLIGVSAVPAFAVSNGTTTYEADCVGQGAAAGQTAPFIEGLTVNTTADTLSPTGDTFGVSGAASMTLIGPVIAGVNQFVNTASTGLGGAVIETIGSTDGTATGSFTYNHTFPNQPTPGRRIPGSGSVGSVSYDAGTPTLRTIAAFPFVPADVGSFVAGPSAGVPATPTIDANSVITAVAPDGLSATISLNALQSATNVFIGTGQNTTLVDPAFSTPADAFTTNGVEGGRANIGITSVTVNTLIVIAGVLQADFGGTVGVAPNGCLLTGFDVNGVAGPGQTGFDPLNTTPILPENTTTDLVLATGGFISQPGTTQMITPPAAAFVNLVTPDTTPPVAGNATATIDRNTTNTTSLALPAKNSTEEPKMSEVDSFRPPDSPL